MNLNKLCPVCQTEYLYHIQKCADCGADLLLPEEQRKAQEEKKRAGEKAVDNRVVVREGDLDWMSELRAVLVDAGIPCMLHSELNCKKGCCGDKFQLVVSPEDLERAQQRIEEYFMAINPELCTANELIKEGKCPACGFSVVTEALECPECGLSLLIIEEEQ
jgi:hypothetical protein